MNSKYLKMLLIILMLLSSALLSAEPRISVRTNYYNLYSTTASGLRAEMNRKGIRWTDGKTYDAFASWYVSWRYEYYTNSGRCALEYIDVSVEIEYTLPKWVTQFMGGKETRIKWLKYIDALKKHEHGHGDIGISAANDIEKALLRLGSNPSCRALGEEANAIGYRILDNYGKREVEYDRSTGHGRTQGAVFP